MPVNNIFDMLTVAVDRAGSTDAVKVAYALEDLRIQTGMGNQSNLTVFYGCDFRAITCG